MDAASTTEDPEIEKETQRDMTPIFTLWTRDRSSDVPIALSGQPPQEHQVHSRISPWFKWISPVSSDCISGVRLPLRFASTIV